MHPTPAAVRIERADNVLGYVWIEVWADLSLPRWWLRAQRRIEPADSGDPFLRLETNDALEAMGWIVGIVTADMPSAQP